MVAEISEETKNSSVQNLEICNALMEKSNSLMTNIHRFKVS